MASWKGIVGKRFSPEEFHTYCKQLTWTTWKPRFVVLHNTSVPSLAQRPSGFTEAHMKNLETYYRDQQKWSAGPHLFVDDNGIWVFTPLVEKGVHSPSWNDVALGVEMLGDYQTEAFGTGRGRAVQDHAVSAIATLCTTLGMDPGATRLHREDPGTTHKTCPGKGVDKPSFLQRIVEQIAKDELGGQGPPTG